MLDEINENPAKRRKKLEKAFEGKESSLRDIFGPDMDDEWYGLCFAYSSVIGFFIGFMMCAGVCIDDINLSLWDYLSTWIVTGIITTILCALFAIFFKRAKTRLVGKKLKSLDNQFNEMCDNYEKAFDREKDRIKEEKFANSKLVSEIVCRLRESLNAEIEGLHRDNAINKLECEFPVNVYNHGVYCGNYDSYDFRRERVQNLQSPLEMAALADIVASRLVQELKKALPIDPSGGKNTITYEVKYYYDESCYEHPDLWEYSVGVIQYTAENAHFLERRDW